MTLRAPNLSNIYPSTGPNNPDCALVNALAPDIDALLQLYFDSKAFRKNPVPCIPTKVLIAIIKFPYNAIIQP